MADEVTKKDLLALQKKVDDLAKRLETLDKDTNQQIEDLKKDMKAGWREGVDRDLEQVRKNDAVVTELRNAIAALQKKCD